MAAKNTNYFCSGKNVALGYAEYPVTESPFAFAFPSGHLTALVGPNGAGKTTLLRAILGEPVLLSGEISLFSSHTSVGRWVPKELAECLAFVPQEHTYPADLTLLQFLRLAYLPRMGLFGKAPLSSSQEISELMAFFSMEKLVHRPLKLLSMGERQKAFLALSLLRHPRLLILDEPTNHLDPGAVHSFWKLLLERQATRPFDILVSTHDLHFVREHCRWICALKNGNLFYNGPSEVFWLNEKEKELFGIPSNRPQNFSHLEIRTEPNQYFSSTI